MTVFEFHEKLTEMFPKSLSAEWDNDGIMLCADLNAEVKKVLVALDATDAAVKYAASNGFDVLLTHHPMLFRGQKSVTRAAFGGKRVIDALLGGVSVISLHTRLDAGEGGVNDTLLKTLGFEVSGYFGDDEMPQISRYSDIEPMTAEELALLVKEKLGAEHVCLTGDKNKTVKRLGVCGGAGGDMLPGAMSAGCDVFLTGECGYNKAQDASEDGIVTIEAGHFYTEAPVCGILSFLAETVAGAEVEYYDSCVSTVF